MASAHRHRRPVVLAMLDLDRFKSYNDQHGHQNGDRYLRKAAIAWRRELRREDVLARYGGEEFTAVMPDTSMETAISALDRLRLATPAPLTCSIGVAEWDGAEDANALIDRADRSLYAAKNVGRNRIEVWPSLKLVAKAAPSGETGQTGASETG
jgi:diguanylate cyclase (GGDEF)-like protein